MVIYTVNNSFRQQLYSCFFIENLKYEIQVLDVQKIFGGLINDNIYTDKSGQIISRETFWKNFDAENDTKIIN